jgi:hypothetical protein
MGSLISISLVGNQSDLAVINGFGMLSVKSIFDCVSRYDCGAKIVGSMKFLDAHLVSLSTLKLSSRL